MSNDDSPLPQRSEEDTNPPAKRNWKHGIFAERSAYYQNIDTEEREWVERIVDSFLAKAPFDASHEGKVEMLYQVAIDMHKRRRANEYISRRGMVQEKYKDYHAEFGTVDEDEENVLHLTADRIQKTNIRILKELGVLDDPDTKQAEAQQSLVEMLSVAEPQAE